MFMCRLEMLKRDDWLSRAVWDLLSYPKEPLEIPRPKPQRSAPNQTSELKSKLENKLKVIKKVKICEELLLQLKLRILYVFGKLYISPARRFLTVIVLGEKEEGILGMVAVLSYL